MMFCFRSVLQIWIILIGFRDTNDFVNLGICKHEFKFTCHGYCRFTLMDRKAFSIFIAEINRYLHHNFLHITRLTYRTIRFVASSNIIHKIVEILQANAMVLKVNWSTRVPPAHVIFQCEFFQAEDTNFLTL